MYSIRLLSHFFAEHRYPEIPARVCVCGKYQIDIFSVGIKYISDSFFLREWELSTKPINAKLAFCPLLQSYGLDYAIANISLEVVHDCNNYFYSKVTPF